MGSSRPRDSIRAGKVRSVNSPPKPRRKSAALHRTAEPRRTADEVVGQLDDTRSVLSVALKALDNIGESGQRRIDAPVVCGPDDVATVLRVGLVCLEDARETLQTGIVEGNP